MYRPLLAAALLAAAVPAAAAEAPAPITAADLRGHIEVLASDAYEGRKPGTEGERKTLDYMRGELARLGFEPAGADGGWLQPVPLVERRPASHQARFAGRSGAVAVGADELVLIGRRAEERLRGAPLIYAGHAAPGDLRGLDVRGAVVLAHYDASGVEGAGSWNDRNAALVEAGAAAVIALLPDQVPWPRVRESYREGQDRLAATIVPQVTGAIAPDAAARLVEAGGARIGGPARRLSVTADLEVASGVRAYTSNNLVARLPGLARSGETVMYLGHWDHLGVCRPEGAADRICNGAVDNASGIAMMIEIGERLARGPRPARDVVILATTAEEMGLLGARHFAASPTVPADRIVAAMNLDTVAIHQKGEPVAVIGRGFAPLDAAVAATAGALGRRIDSDDEAEAFVQRQDGYELAKAGIPTIMAGGSFANMKVLGSFLSGPYHKPDDDLARDIPLEGAAEDADFLFALGLRLADPAYYAPPPRWRSADPAPM